MSIRNYIRHAYRLIAPRLYGRQHLKLLLQTSITNLDERTRQIVLATDFFTGMVSPIPIRAPFGDSVLVVAPHQDDEAIGCGGALALQVQSGANAHIVLLQDGSYEAEESGMTRAEMTALRNAESKRAAAVLGMESPDYFDYADLAGNAREAAARLERIIRDRKVDAIFAPFVLDNHPDHRTAAYLVADALASISWDVRVLGYEVWGYCIPNVVVVIDDVIQKKLDMLACFPFANSAVDYVHSTKGLNMYHSRLLGTGLCRYAERFFELPRKDYIDFIAQVRPQF